MKKLVSVVAFTFLLMFSAQTISAQSLSQNQEKAEVVAKAQVAELTTQLNLTGDQSRTLYRAFVAKEVNYRKLVNGQDSNDATVVANKGKIDETFMISMKKTLTEEQYNQWLSNLKN